MESNRKRKLREKGFSPDTLAHFKVLRRKQKNRRRNRKKGKQPELDGMSIVQPPPTNSPSSLKRKRVGEDQYLPRGKRMVSASQKQKKNDTGMDAVAAEVQQHLRPTSHPRYRIQTPAATKECAPKKPIVRSPESSATSSTYLKNINAANLTRKAGARSIGSGSTCYLGKYRGIRVVIKEYKERTTKHKDSLPLLQKEARHEANVLMKLGDHPGIALSFGVCLKEKPISIVIKFHGDGKESVTLYKAAKTKITSEKHEWQAILCETSEALNHVHRCGYAHSDLKADNIVLHRREDERLHPVIIDFGKSVAFSEAKNPPPKSEHLKSLYMYKDSYIAPELVNGTGKPSATSDVYSLAFLVKKIYGILNFSNIAVIKRALENSPDDRPTIKDIKAALTADC